MKHFILMIGTLGISIALLASVCRGDTKDNENDKQIYTDLMSEAQGPTLMQESVLKTSEKLTADDKITMRNLFGWINPGIMGISSTEVYGCYSKIKLGFKIDEFAGEGDEIFVIKSVSLHNTLGYEPITHVLWVSPKTQRVLTLFAPDRDSLNGYKPSASAPRRPSTQPSWTKFIQPDSKTVDECKLLAAKAYQDKMKDKKTGHEKPADPVAFVSFYPAENLTGVVKDSPLYEIAILNEDGKLMGLFWENPLDKSIKAIYGPWVTQKPEIFEKNKDTLLMTPG